jgi:phage tail sheath gpL-like
MKPSVLLRGALLLVLAVASASAFAKPSNKWRLEFSGSARSDGTIVVSVTPAGGETVEVSTDIKKGDGENRVADKVRDSLKAALANYRLSLDDGEDVLIKKRSGQPDFEAAVVSNSVESVRIHLQRE